MRSGGILPTPSCPQPELPATIADNRFRSSEYIRWSAAAAVNKLVDRPDLAYLWPTVASKRSA